MLWLGRILQGVGGGAGNVVARAMVRDLFQGPEAQRVMATIQMLFGIAPAVAPMIGGLLLGIHWHSIFIFLAIYASISDLSMNDIAQVTFKLAQPLMADPYQNNRSTGAFIIIDESTYHTVGAGMIA